MKLLTLVLIMGTTTNKSELIRRYEDKSIIDINSEKHEVMSTCDSTGFNDLLSTILPRLSTTISKLVTRINNINDDMYNKTMLEMSNMNSYSGNIFIRRQSRNLSRV